MTQLGYDTRFIHARLAKRQLPVEDADKFTDEHYPTWYGADFSNVWVRTSNENLRSPENFSRPSSTLVGSTSHTVLLPVTLSLRPFFCGPAQLRRLPPSRQTSLFRSASPSRSFPIKNSRESL